MMEEKDKEISRLLDDNKSLRQLLDSRPSVSIYALLGYLCYIVSVLDAVMFIVCMVEIRELFF